MKRLLSLLLMLALTAAQRSMAQTASFNFSLNPQAVSGWVNAHGDPSDTLITATAPSGISVSSVGATNWSRIAYTSDPCAYDAGGASGGTFFPASVMLNHWFQYGTSTAAYNALLPQLIISGLNVDSVYTIKMTGSFVLGIPQYYELNPIRYTVMGTINYGYIDIDGDSNTTAGAVFHNIAPDSTGKVRIFVNTYGGSNVASICGLQVTSGQTAGVVPSVSLTKPTNSTILPEDANVAISATATETGGTISEVQFYANGTLIGVDSSAPYSMTWNSPDPGTYTITARAVDGTGGITTSSAGITIESLNYFWSTTGNIATGGDTSFVGTVDSNRLAFRTKDIERMTISAIGNIGIGTDSPTAQLHTTGSVRFAGLASDSSASRILVSDSTGKLYYQNMGSTGVLSPGPGLGGTSTGIALGDSIPGPGPHSFTSNRYQYLNGYQYSIGGSVNDPVNRPVFRMYDNGDITASTTMDRSLAAPVPRGLRYYSKLGVLQIGSLDRLDTSANVSSMTGGIVLDAEDSASTSVLKAGMYDAYVAGNAHHLDSSAVLGTTMVNGGDISLTTGNYDNDIINGYGIELSSGLASSMITGGGITISPNTSVYNAMISGGGISISKNTSESNISGWVNSTLDTSRGSLVAGALNQFGGLWQTVSGVYLINRTPAGVIVGSGNVDFANMPTSGTQGLSTPGLAGYPLFALGNSSSYGGFRSNALTVLYNGRTQINTTGFGSALTQAQVTPAAALDVVSTNTGVLLPRLTTAQRNAIASGDLHNGLLLYNTDSSAFQYYTGSAWNSVGGGSGTASRWLFANGTAYDSVDNIAIGTNNPQGYRLAVNGAGIFTKIVAKPQASWPDYVFDKGYRLSSLEELAQYIRVHHHLPDMASEAEIIRNGIDLGAQQTTLLKKVEELTLYLIRENQSLSEQTKQLEDQNKQLAGQNQQLADQSKQLNDQNARLEVQQKEIDALKAMIQANHKK